MTSAGHSGSDPRASEAEVQQASIDAFTHCALGVAIGDPVTNRFRNCNPAFARMVGRSVEDVLGRPILELYAPGVRARVRELIAEADRVGTIHYESEMVRPKGEIVPVEVSVAVVRDAQGAILHRVATVTDISERKKAASALEVSERQFRALFATTPQPMWVYDLHTLAFLDVNEAAIRLYGYSREEFLGMTIREIRPPEDVPELLRNVSQTVGGAALSGPWRHRKRDGTLLSVEISSHEARLEGREARLVLVIDVTDRLAANRALQERDAQFRLLFENSFDAVLLGTPEGGVLAANSAACTLFGRTAEEICEVGRKGLVDLTDPRLPALLVERERQGRFQGELRFLRKDGTAFEAEVTSAFFPDSQGAPRSSIVIRDITERKRAEAELHRRLELQHQISMVAESVPGMIYSFRLRPDGATSLPYCNARIEELWGLRPEELRDDFSSAFAMIHPDDREAVGARIAESARTMESWHSSFRVLHPKKGEVWLEGQSVPQREADGSVLWHGYLHDVTDRRRSEMEISRQASLIRALIDSIPDLIFFKDQNGVYLGCNVAFSKFVGRRIDEIVKRPDVALFPSDVAESFRVQDRRMFAHLRSLRNEEWVTYPDGRRVLLDTLKTPYWGPDGALIGLLGISRDITEQRSAEAALRKNESRLREALNAANAGIWEWEIASNQNHWSDEVWALYGLDPKKHPASYESWRQAIRLEEREAIEAKVNLACAKGEPFEIEWRVQLPDDQVRWLLSRGNPQQDAAGKTIAYRGIVVDISARKRSEAALLVEEERYRSLVETSFDWVWEVDTQTRYTYASPRVKDLLGYSPEEVLGRTPFELMPEDEARRVAGLFGKLRDARRPIVGLENTNRHRDGRLIVVETNGMPVFAPDGTWLGYRGMDRDITERRAAERAVRLRGAALNAAANAIVITNTCGIVEWANPAFTTLSGWELSEVVGRDTREFLSSGQHPPEFFQEMWSTILAGKVWRGEIVNRRKDGKLRTVEMTIAPFADEQGAASHFIAVQQDITEQKLLESQTRHTQRMEAIGTLAGGVAHDLNNILTPIMMVAGLLKGRVTEERDAELLGMLQQGAQRGSEIIRQLLTFSRGEEGQRGPVQLKHLFKEMMAIMRETFPREIELRLELSPSLAVVNADPTQLHQVLFNLCVNARDAMPEGGTLVLRAENLQLTSADAELPVGTQPGCYVRLEVRDSGRGIPEEIRHRIFDPFFTTKPLGKGTGLGLSTVQGIVRGHGGFLTVDSVPGQGAAFRVYLPAGNDAPAPVAPVPLASAVAGRGQFILLVEDEPHVRDATRIILQSKGYEVCAADNGKTGLELYQRHRAEIQLVLTDLMMPVMNGTALIRELRRLDGQLPVIACSGLEEISKESELALMGVAELLRKPYSVESLLDAVERQLSRSRAAPPAPPNQAG